MRLFIVLLSSITFVSSLPFRYLIFLNPRYHHFLSHLNHFGYYQNLSTNKLSWFLSSEDWRKIILFDYFKPLLTGSTGYPGLAANKGLGCGEAASAECVNA